MKTVSVGLPEFLARIASVADSLGSLLDRLQHDLSETDGTGGIPASLQNLDRATQMAREIGHVLEEVSAETGASASGEQLRITGETMRFRLGDVEAFLKTGQALSPVSEPSGEVELF
ncbi:hypothetical protein GOB93_10190 [Acetobacter musti]|uniref:Chemotaxis protein n=1 Tax=Acetobacter musti TaxID=864732 RepID=A0ABX0JQF6_9PROT|nr:hypothetical protein [Acetobacter musti]NHN85009.1 hypothetical protein [Acetobacter musti]